MITIEPPEALTQVLVQGAVPLLAQHEVAPPDVLQVRVLEPPTKILVGLAVRLTDGPGPPPLTVTVADLIPVLVPVPFQHSILYVVVTAGLTDLLPPVADCQVLFQVTSVPPVAQHDVTPPEVVQVRVLLPPAEILVGLAVRVADGPPPPEQAAEAVAFTDPDQVEEPLLLVARTV